MASNPEPIQMPKMPKYQPQVDLNPDDPDQYMMLVPASIAKINTKLPILQMVFAATAVLFAVLAVSIDEMSDGDVKSDYGGEVDYDCGWKELRFNINGYSEQIAYNSDFCEMDDVIDDDFCTQSTMNGRIWLASSIIGILITSASIPVLLWKKPICNGQCKIGGKDSWPFFIMSIIGCGSFAIASMWWWLSDKCEDIEQYNNSDSQYVQEEFDTSIGPSLYLMWIALFFTIAGILISSLHICNRVQREYYPQRIRSQQQNVQQPRVQTHVVN